MLKSSANAKMRPRRIFVPGLCSLNIIKLNLQFSLFMPMFETFFRFKCIFVHFSHFVFKCRNTIIFVATFFVGFVD